MKRILMISMIALLVLASCSDANTSTGSLKVDLDSKVAAKTIMPTKYVKAGYYTLKLFGGNTLVAETSTAETSATFDGLAVGTYDLKVYGYKSDDSKELVSYGEATGTVKAGSDNYVAVDVSPINSNIDDTELYGTISIDISWASDITITRIDLVDVDTSSVAASQSIENPDTASSVTFEQSIPVGIGRIYRLEFYNGEQYLGSSIEEVYNIYANQISTTDNPTEYTNLQFSNASSLRGFTVSSVSTFQHLNELQLNFIVPETFEEIRITDASTGNTIETFTNANIEVSAGEIKSFVVSDLEDGKEYTFDSIVVLSDGIKSLVASATGTTAKRTTEISFSYSEDDMSNLAPGKTMTIVMQENGDSFGGTWKSSNDDVATVSDSGVVTGTGIGSATISYTSNNNNQTKSIDLDISLPQAKLEFSLSDSSIDLSWTKAGVADKYFLYKDDVLLTTVTEVGDTMTYSDTDIKSGKTYTYYIKAIYNGFTDLASTSNSVSATFKNPAITINVLDGPARLAVEMSGLKQNGEFNEDEEIVVSASINNVDSYSWYLNGKNIGSGNTISIDSSTSGIKKGYVANKQSLMLKVTSDNMDYSGSISFYTVEKKASKVEFTEDSMKIYKDDNNAYVKAIPMTVDGEEASLARVVYTSSDESIATVDRNTGKVTVLKSGDITISATTLDGNYSDTIAIEAAIPVGEISFVNPQATLLFANDRDGNSYKETITLTSTVENEKYKGESISYSISDDSIISVVETSNGVYTVTPLKAGSATITISSDVDKAQSATHTITVYEAAIFAKPDYENKNSEVNLSESNTYFYMYNGAISSGSSTKDLTIRYRSNASDTSFTDSHPEGYTTEWVEGEKYATGALSKYYAFLSSHDGDSAIAKYSGSYSGEGYFTAHITTPSGSPSEGITVRAYGKFYKE